MSNDESFRIKLHHFNVTLSPINFVECAFKHSATKTSSRFDEFRALCLNFKCVVNHFFFSVVVVAENDRPFNDHADFI